MDLHKAQIQGFFDIPVDHLFAAPVIIDYLARLDSPKLTLVAPDAGGAERARAYAKRLDAELAVIDKRRTDDGTAEVMNVIGDVEGRTCIIQDDIVDTAGTITKAAMALKNNGAERVLACAVHGVLSGPAIERIEKSPIDKMIVTNTIPQSRGGGGVQQDRRALGGAAARAGDQEHSRGDVGLVACSCREQGSGTGSGIRELGIRNSYGSDTRSNGARHLRQERGAAHAAGGPRAGRGLRRERGRGAGQDGDADCRRSRRRCSKILHSESGANTLISLKLAGAATRKVLVKEYQLDPVTHQLLHADFYRVAMDRVLRVTIPVVVKGEPKGVKQQGGILEFVRREIEVECLPGDIPEHVEVDVSELMLHQGVRVRDVATDPKWKPSATPT